MEVKCPFHTECSKSCPWKIAKDNGWLTSQNPIEKITEWVQNYFIENPKMIEEIKKSKKKDKVLNHIKGKIMKEYPGANPTEIENVIKIFVE